jgi:hypothetical protein
LKERNGAVAALRRKSEWKRDNTGVVRAAELVTPPFFCNRQLSTVVRTSRNWSRISPPNAVKPGCRLSLMHAGDMTEEDPRARGRQGQRICCNYVHERHRKTGLEQVRYSPF